MTQDPNTTETLTIEEFAGEESLIHACTQLPCRELILTGKAKALFSVMMAEGLNHPPAAAWINKWPAIRGYKYGAGFNEGDPQYLGCGAMRVWFGTRA